MQILCKRLFSGIQQITSMLVQNCEIVFTSVWKGFIWSQLKGNGKTWRQISISSSVYKRSISPFTSHKTHQLGCGTGHSAAELPFQLLPSLTFFPKQNGQPVSRLTIPASRRLLGTASISTLSISTGGNKNWMCICKLSCNISAYLLQVGNSWCSSRI